MWVGALLWTTPRHTSESELRAAVTGHQVRSWEQTDQVPRGPVSSTGFGLGTVRGSSTVDGAADIVVWSDPHGHRHWARVTTATAPGSNSFEHAIGAWLSRSVPHADGLRTPAVTRWTGLAFWVPALAAVLVWITPRLGTRWFWFWVSSLSLGIGLLAFVLLECLRDPEPRKNRRSGLVGFGWASGASLLLSLAAAIGSGLLGVN